jgi:hypothetical protein
METVRQLNLCVKRLECAIKVVWFLMGMLREKDQGQLSVMPR